MLPVNDRGSESGRRCVFRFFLISASVIVLTVLAASQRAAAQTAPQEKTAVGQSDLPQIQVSGVRPRKRGKVKNPQPQPAAVSAPNSDRAVLSDDAVDAVAHRLADSCAPAAAVPSGDSYASRPSVSGAPVYRLVCGNIWYDIDASNGALLEKLDSSRRVFRWLFGGLHRLDFPFLTTRPALRTGLIVGLCIIGLVFSLTGVVIAWRRVLSCFLADAGPRRGSY